MPQPHQGPLILAAHGHGDGSPANLLILDLARRLGAALGIPVSAAFNMGTPSFAQAAAEIQPAANSPAAVVLPIMTSDGYFVRGPLARAFSTAHAPAHAPVLVAPPIGIDPALRHAAAIDLLDALGQRPPDLLLVVGHGTRRSRSTSLTTQALAARVAALRPGLNVQTAYLDQPPLLEDAVHAAHRAGLRDIAILPWLIGGGSHDLHDIAERAGLTTDLSDAAPRGRWIDTPLGQRLIGRPLADLPAFAMIAESAARRALDRPLLRLGTRSSRLALWQARLAADTLAARGVPTQIVPLHSSGDRDLSTPIPSFGREGIFTDDLEAALHAGTIDAAVHSLKDMPHHHSPDHDPSLITPAMLERGPANEALVSRHHLTLDQLPPGSTVGTCSPRRARRVLELRPDLTVAPIRGPVESRVAQVDRGRFDAAVLALAGLERLGLAHRASEVFTQERFPHEPGQGVIALQARAHDPYALSLLARADHAPTRLQALRERAPTPAPAPATTTPHLTALAP